MKGNNRGFLVLEILIAGIVLTSSIAASMYLFRMGFDYLGRANDSNVITSKLPDAMNLLRTVDLAQEKDEVSMGDEVTLTWDAQLQEKMRPVVRHAEGTGLSAFEHYLYKVRFRLRYKTLEREYEMHVFKYRRVQSVQSGGL